VQDVEDVAYDAHPEFVLNEVDFVFIEIMIVALGILLRLLLLYFFTVSTIELILNFDSFCFLLVE